MPFSSNPGGSLKRSLAILALIGFVACGGGSDSGTLPDNTGGINSTIRFQVDLVSIVGK
jgi:hypothetical protein